jgi:WD40 repeat protein/tRNA A-37 threonylcarbamoyl transferase component Bud32
MDHEQRLDEVITTYLQDVEDGRAPDETEWLARYPDLADELRTFLAGQHSLERVAGPIRPQASEQETLGPAPWQPPGPGKKVRYFGDYELLEEIARGGMGVVYKARQVSLNRIVALKMILAGQLARDADVQRFYAEAQTAANLQHPNIVAIHEVGQFQGQHYFSMDYVEGQSLAAVIREHPLPPDQAAANVKTVAEAIHYAHQKGVLHRDLKPGNVLIDASGQPRVTDFGLAKRFEASSGQASPGSKAGEGLTATGAILGTPSYLPPEQAGSGRGQVGPASDVYSLGTILYELVTGRPPFQGPTPMDTVLQVLSDEPVPPGRLQPQLPVNLETICLKCLHKEPHKRYATAAALAEDLRRFLAGEPILARPVGRVERTVKWVRRRPLVASLLAAVVASVLAGAAVSAYFAFEASNRADEAEKNYLLAKDKTNLAEQKSKLASDKTQETLVALKQTDQARKDAEREQKRAEKNEFNTRQSLYVARVNQAHLAWQAGQVGQVLDLLEDTSPAKTGGYDFRGFEWYYLRRLCRAGHTILTRKEQPLSAIACSPDGKMVATASTALPLTSTQGDSSQPALKLWNAITGQLLHTLKGYSPSPVFLGSLAISPDGKRIAAPGEAGILVWDSETGKTIQTIPGKDDDGLKTIAPIGNGLAFSPDGHALAMVTGKAVRLWDFQTAKEATPALAPHSVPLTCVTFARDGSRLVAGAQISGGLFPGPTVLAWETKTGKGSLALHHPGGVIAVAVSPDGKTIASAGGDFTVRLWAVEGKKEKWTVRAPGQWFSSLVFTPDGRWLIGGSLDGSINVWDVKTGSPLRTLRGHTLGVSGLALPSDGRRLASSGLDGTARLWEWDRDQEAVSLQEPLGPVTSLAFHPDGKRLASGSAGVSLWDLEKRKVVRSYKEFLVNFGTMAMGFSPDGTRLATASVTVKVWDTATGKKIFGKDPPLFGQPKNDQAEEDEFGMIWGLAYSPDGKHLAWGSHIRDAATGKKIRAIVTKAPDPLGASGSMAYSPDGKHLAIGGMTKVISLVDTSNGKTVRTFTEFPDRILKVSFTPDGHRLLAASTSRARVWELPSGQELLDVRLTSTFTPINPGVLNPGKASFSADGRRLAMAPGDGTVRIWDMASGQQVLSLRAPGSEVFCVAFSSDGHWLGAGGHDGPNKGVLTIWDARPMGGKE